MRAITDHVVPGDTAPQLTIMVMDKPGAGGANHEYMIGGLPVIGAQLQVRFQNGPIKEFGVNGVTQEVLLAIVIDRLRSFQAGPFACTANEKALTYCESALSMLQMRTRDRIARGVEGQTKA